LTLFIDLDRGVTSVLNAHDNILLVPLLLLLQFKMPLLLQYNFLAAGYVQLGGAGVRVYWRVSAAAAAQV
jgi:hypothetical protein